MDYTTIKQVIDNTITSNSNQEITGTILNNTLNSIVDSLGAGYKYGGLVDSTYSSTPNVNYFYVATQEGAYSAFNQVIDSKGFYLLSYFDDAWKKDDIIKIAQETGDEETTLMSQKAIKEAIENIDFSIGGGSFAANLYLSNTDSDVLGYKTLSYENDLTETELTTTFSSNDGDVILGKYLFAEGLDTTILPSGKWLMDYYMKVSTSLEETKVWLNLFVRHTNGTETVLYTDTETDINNTSYSDNYISVERILTQYAVDETDRLGITVFAKTTRNVNLTISSIIGGVRGAYLNTPLVLKHSQLRSLNGDDNFLHITASEKASYEAKPTQADLSLKEDTTSVDAKLTLKADITYVDNAINNSLWYGYEYDKTVSDPDVTRIGNLTLHKANNLPLQSAMKGCLIDNVTGALTKYLPKSDWTSETLDGSAGQVMVETQKFYFKHETDGDIERYKFSTVPLGGYIEIPKLYIGAVEGSVNRVDNTLCSVVNASADYRGGNNNADWDDTYRSLLGRPATSISRTNFTTYARNRGTTTEWNQYLYLAHKVLYWMFVLEYGTRNSQAPYTAELDSNGFRQGGLGNGVTTISSTAWSDFNSYYPFVPCGFTNSLGNGTGEVDYTSVDGNNDELWTVKVNRYRGIEMPFGHIWKWTEGINVDVKTDVDGGTSEVYVCKDPAKFSDTSNVDYELRGLEARSNGYVKEIIGGDNGDIISTEIGGGSSTYFCDYHYASTTSSNLRGVRFGGSADSGSNAGFACSSASYAPSNAYANFGARLCFKPKTN